MVHEKNWRVSLCVQELHHPQDCSHSSILVFVFVWFGIFCWLGQQLLFWDFRRVRVSPFLPFHTFTWHDCGMVIRPVRVSTFLSSDTFAWHSCGWWGRRACGRLGMINSLPWRCYGCWRKQAWGRTRWQARNHDRNEVLRVAVYSNPVYNEMWFLTVDPFVRISVFIAKLSERQYCWRILEDFHSQEFFQFFDIHCGLFMRLHFSIGCFDYRRITRFRQSIHVSISQVLVADHVHRRSGVDNKFSFLKFGIWCRQTPIFPKVRRMLLCFSPVIVGYLRPASTLLHGHLALATLSVPETDPHNFEALGSRWWGSPGQIIPSEGFWSRMSAWRTTAFANFTHRIGFRVSKLFRKIDEDFGGSIFWNTQPNCRVFDE